MFYTLLILLAFFVDISFVHTNYNIPGFSVLISQMIFLCILWLRNRSKLSQNDVSFSIQKILSHGKKFPSIPLLIMLTIVLSIWFSIFTNPLFTWIFLLLLILVNIVLVALLYSPGLTFGIYPYKDGNFLRFIFTTIFSRPDIALSTVRQDLYKNDHIKTYGPTILKAFYGLIILMCIIVPLLLSSDIIFQKLLRDVFSTLFSGLDAFGFIMRVGVIIFIFWLLLTIFRSLEDAYYTENDIHLPSLKIDKIYNYIIL